MGKKVVKYKLVRHRWPDEIQADRKRKMRKAMVIAICFVCFFGGFGVNELLNKQRGLSDKTFAKFSEIYNIMSKEFYFGKDKEDFDDVLTIFIHAPFESRVRRVKEDYQEEHEDYKKFVMKKDKARSNYYNYYTTKKWGQLKNFDLTINSDFGIEEVADIIVALYQKGEHRQK